ncbi:hypothetical protein PVA44_04565 [Entomospira nematocerorum]|uniref:Uncharacterized protein n=1 Tax=Entomospira nematocerorum TaxID=2719987 RepID=A0A968GFA6_9SPIO|nr:hypothetical protein [Entomospira nematocera]NIZ46706.1 hypothetical protein [Entomospira nematocera]WDI33498.1 hypothetical protein PVA44_04565 [Entomospira nematocera]
MNRMMSIGRVWIFLLGILCSGYSLFAQSEFYQSNSLFQPVGAVLDSLPVDGFALHIKPSQTYGSLLYEERLHYYDNILQEHWHFFYLADGRLHAKKKLDKSYAFTYEEIFIYNRMKELRMVIVTQKQYLFNDNHTLWKIENNLHKIALQGVSLLHIEDRTPFKKDPLLQEQIEEIWQDGILTEIKFYRFGEVQRSKVIESEQRFSETIYNRGQAVFRRTVNNDVVLHEEYLDEE